MDNYFEDGFISVPKDHDAERMVISALIAKPEAFLDVANVLGSQDFHSAQYAEIFDALLELHHDRSPACRVTIIDKLKRHGEVPYALQEMVDECVDTIVSGENADHYAKIVKTLSLRRSIIKLCNDSSLQASSGDNDIEEVHESLMGKLNNLVSDVKTEVQSMQSAVKDVFDTIVERIDNPDSCKSVKTGFSDLDDMTGGFKAGELIILAARPSVGKTALALEIAKNAASISKEPTMFFSLEMSTRSCVERLLSSSGNIPAKLLHNGGVKHDRIDAVMTASNELYQTPMAFDDSGHVTVWDIKRKSRAYKHKHGLGLIVVDYLQLMVGDSKNGREREVAEMSRQLKILAKELEVPILALSQLNRGLESRTNKEPQLSDLRESGAIEQDADICAFLHKEDSNEMDANCGGREDGFTESEEVRLILRKNRHGAIGDVRLAFEPSFTRFKNAEDNFKPTPMSSNSAAIKAAAGWQ